MAPWKVQGNKDSCIDLWFSGYLQPQGLGTIAHMGQGPVLGWEREEAGLQVEDSPIENTG